MGNNNDEDDEAEGNAKLLSNFLYTLSTRTLLLLCFSSLLVLLLERFTYC
jgi:hypothetical protein